jgi:hypothetical protein
MTTEQLEQIARAIVANIQDDQGCAQLLATRNNKTTKVAEHGDVYELLGREARRPHKAAKTADALTVTTCGWAAPITDDDDNENDDLPPSLHPRRRRVCLAVTVSTITNEVVSALQFADETQPIVDYGNARGSLADAVANLALAIQVAR